MKIKKMLKNLEDCILLEQKDMRAEELIINLEEDRVDKVIQDHQYFI